MEKSMNNKFPPQIKYIIGNEAAERFSFYGMRSILTIFMVTRLLVPEPEAEATYHLFVGACYLLPLLGAYISDHIWGKYKTIMFLSLFYCLGHGVLALWESKTGLYWGLGLIALGSGGIKPCVSAFVGDQFTAENKHLLTKVFDLFYWSINFGSFFSTLLIPWTRNHYGSHLAFGIPGILMGLATLIFWLGTKHYVNVPPSKSSGDGFFAVLFEAFKQKKILKKPDFFANAIPRFGEEAVDGARAIFKIAKVYITVSIFWALYDQSGSSWVLQGEKMNLKFFGFDLDPSQLQALNPIMVMVMIPLFSYGIYPWVQEKLKIKVTPLRKMTAGMFVASFSFVIVMLFQIFLDGGNKINIAWQFLPYLVITAAEILVSITGLEFAYTQAPRKVKSTIMSFWQITVFLGNMLTAFISKINIFSGWVYFAFFALLMFGVSFIFAFTASRYQSKEYLEA